MPHCPVARTAWHRSDDRPGPAGLPAQPL